MIPSQPSSPNTASNAIDVRDLRKSFKNVNVLHDVSFSVRTGSVFALLGSNGAGKTTTINILTTLIKADGGSATVCGFDIANNPDKVRRSISVTGQFAAIDVVLTGRENIELVARLRHLPHPADVATQLLAQFSLTDAADRRAATYSGGMARRLDIAMSLVGNPSLIFLDEPTTGLDPEARNQMWETIHSLTDQGTTVFLTTQYLEEADRLADTVAMLHKGTIAAIGTPAELKRLTPGGIIDLAFADDAQATQATRILSPAMKVTPGEPFDLVVETDGSVRQIAAMFIRLLDADLEPIGFAERIPSLDDVFFAITSRPLDHTEEIHQ